MPLSTQVILVQLETLRLENRHLSEMLEKTECGMLEVYIRDQRWEAASVVCPLPGNSNSLCPGLSKCLVEFSELKTQAKEAICEEIRCRNTEHLSQRAVRRTAETEPSSQFLLHGFWPVFFTTCCCISILCQFTSNL